MDLIDKEDTGKGEGQFAEWIKKRTEDVQCVDFENLLSSTSNDINDGANILESEMTSFIQAIWDARNDMSINPQNTMPFMDLTEVTDFFN